MSQAGFSNRRVVGQMGAYHSVMDLLMQRLKKRLEWLMNLYDLAGPKQISPIEDRLIAWFYRRNCFATSACIRDELNFRGHVSIS